MEDSILTGTKKLVGLGEEYTPFDHDIITHINSTFSVLTQLGIGPDEGFMIEDAEKVWDDFLAEDPRINMVRSYIGLKVRLLFDPPTTGYFVEALKKQIEEYEWRLNVNREVDLYGTD